MNSCIHCFRISENKKRSKFLTFSFSFTNFKLNVGLKLGKKEKIKKLAIGEIGLEAIIKKTRFDNINNSNQ